MGTASHAAVGPALGYLYQARAALLILLRRNSDEAAVTVEGFDDVVLTDRTQTLAHQLKHSSQDSPPPLTISSSMLWKTLKVWIDILSEVALAETEFRLVTVADIASTSPLLVVLGEANDDDIATLDDALLTEAKRVLAERAAVTTGRKPYVDRAAGCQAFVATSQAGRKNLLRRIRIEASAPTIGDIEENIAAELTGWPVSMRTSLATQLVEWWDRQVVLSLCGDRPRALTRTELLAQTAEFGSEIQRGDLTFDFAGVNHPQNYNPDGVLARQIALVGGVSIDHSKAILEEWRARKHRGRWTDEDPSRYGTIVEHDDHLVEEWNGEFEEMREECGDEEDRCRRGLALLRWTHKEAPARVRPIREGHTAAAHYARGAYQVLAIERRVGWHPDFIERLDDET